MRVILWVELLKILGVELMILERYWTGARPNLVIYHQLLNCMMNCLVCSITDILSLGS